MRAPSASSPTARARTSMSHRRRAPAGGRQPLAYEPRSDGLSRAPGAAWIVGVGSSLKFCLVAEGKADLYPRFGPTSEWDTAAGQALLEAAGGHVTGHGRPSPALQLPREPHQRRLRGLQPSERAARTSAGRPGVAGSARRGRRARTAATSRPAASEYRIPPRPRPWSAARPRPRRSAPPARDSAHASAA